MIKQTVILVSMATVPTYAANLDPHLEFTPRSVAQQAAVDALTRSATNFIKRESEEANPAGTATVARRKGAKGFSAPSANLPADREVDFKLGNALFRKEWQPTTADATGFTGLGPQYNARSCVQCHLNDGRGHPPAGPQDGAATMLMKIGMPLAKKLENHRATLPDPVYGNQLQNFAVGGAQPEFRLQVSYSEFPVSLAGGDRVHLRQPAYCMTELSKGPLHRDARVSPRVAPQMIGLGLIEAIPAADIMVGADPDDADGDGISGRANMVFALEHESLLLGRFGLKAISPTIRQQTAVALTNDMGVSTALVANGGEQPEITETIFDFIASYSAQIGVPARGALADRTVLRGKQLFYQAGCVACHRPKFVTHILPLRPELSNQLIWPYSDFLLHDMGAGLADGFPEGLARGNEWRTPPLWGIGLTQDVSGHSFFLHDGRARSLLEAVLWHGGEAQGARDKVVEMPAGERRALIRFLESL
ncbi:MAG: c-type cytochrome [Rhodobacteraceae bacterium]|nr:c-type cytochrome [Paracoccaceae bacterium]